MKRLLIIQLIWMISVGILSAQSPIRRETLVYSVKDGEELHLDKYVDKNVAFNGKRPVLIYVHGGGFTTGSRINALQIQYCKHFAAQGFVAVAIDYRLGIKDGGQSDQETIMHAVSLAYGDLIDATAFIIGKADEWNIDTGKIIISGGSAGAITCLTAEYDICSEGKYSSILPEGFNYAGLVSHAGSVVVPGDTLTWKKAPCPMLLMHGNKDQLVSFDVFSISGNLYAGSNYIHNQFVKLKFPHWLYEEDGADHIVALKPLQYNFGETDTFIDKFVMKQQKAIVHTVWGDDKPDSMDKMMDVVPLYIIGWDKTDDEVK